MIRAWLIDMYAQARVLAMLAYVLAVNYLFFRLPRDAGQKGSDKCA